MPADPNITARPMEYQKELRIRVDVPNTPEYIRKIKSVRGARWSATHRCWHAPRTPEAWRELRAQFGAIQVVDTPAAEIPPPPQGKRIKSLEKMRPASTFQAKMICHGRKPART